MAKTRSPKRRIVIRDRLGRLTYRGACRLLADGDEGEARLRKGGAYEINLPRDVYLGGDTLRVNVPDVELPDDQAVVTIVEMTSKPKGLHLNCEQCPTTCDHIAAVLGLVLDENGKSQIVSMGCYGIGVSRIVAAAIEQNHDDKGIIWPDVIAPFQIAIVPLNMHKSEVVAECASELYESLLARGVDVFLDDRNERPGVKFADMELVGIPHRVVIGDRALGEGNIEYKGRRDSDSQLIPQDGIVDFLKQLLTQ